MKNIEVSHLKMAAWLGHDLAAMSRYIPWLLAVVLKVILD